MSPEEIAVYDIPHFSVGLFGTLEKIVPKVKIDKQASIATYHHK
jgi:hypothetical protein